MKRNSLIIIEGSSGSGKSTLVNYLSEKLDIPIYQRVWFNTDLTNVWMENITLTQLYNTNLKLIQDRSLVSFCFYNRNFLPVLFWFAENLVKWDYAKIIYVYSDPEKIIKNIVARGDRTDRGYTIDKIANETIGMREMLGYIPTELVWEYKVAEYDQGKSWLQEVERKIKGELV